MTKNQERLLSVSFSGYFGFFVSKKDPALAQRLATGYERALKNGTWQKIIQEQYQEVLGQAARLNIKNRIIIDLVNPYFPDEAKKVPLMFPDLLK